MELPDAGCNSVQQALTLGDRVRAKRDFRSMNEGDLGAIIDILDDDEGDFVVVVDILAPAPAQKLYTATAMGRCTDFTKLEPCSNYCKDEYGLCQTCGLDGGPHGVEYIPPQEPEIRNKRNLEIKTRKSKRSRKEVGGRKTTGIGPLELMNDEWNAWEARMRSILHEGNFTWNGICLGIDHGFQIEAELTLSIEEALHLSGQLAPAAFGEYTGPKRGTFEHFSNHDGEFSLLPVALIRRPAPGSWYMLQASKAFYNHVTHTWDPN